MDIRGKQSDNPILRPEMIRLPECLQGNLNPHLTSWFDGKAIAKKWGETCSAAMYHKVVDVLGIWTVCPINRRDRLGRIQLQGHLGLFGSTQASVLGFKRMTMLLVRPCHQR